MMVSKHLVLDTAYKKLAFCGGKSRQKMIRQLSESLIKQGNRVLFASTEVQKLPISGEVVIGQDISIVLDQLKKEFVTETQIYVGKQLTSDGLSGFTLTELSKIAENLPADYLLIELGKNTVMDLKSPTIIVNWIKNPAWEQLVYCLDMRQVGIPLSGKIIEDKHWFFKHFPDAEYLSQNILATYLANRQKGVRTLFEQKWPVLLLLNGVDGTAQENQAITFARELKQMGLSHISISNLENIIIPI